MKSIVFSAVLAGALCLGAKGAPAMSLDQVAEGFVSPTALQSVPNADYMLVSDQVGVIYKVKKGAPIEPWLDLTSKLTKLNQGFDERGLLGFALHPDYANNGRFFVVYSAPLKNTKLKGWDHTWTLAEFKAEGGAAKLDSEKILLEIDHPYFNHNAGSIAFGGDGHLYLAVGDGGAGNDKDEKREKDKELNPPGHVAGGNGQDLNTLLGKILRVDVSKPGVLSIPTDNPFKDGKGRPEIYAWGMRNPWRISFDRETKELYAADIGQELYEEVDVIKKGGNYGWPVREGFHCFDQNDGRSEPEDCARAAKDGSPFIDPIFEYKSYRSFRNDPGALGISITGGYVYRGKAIPQMAGKYVFADWSRNMGVADGVLLVATRISPKGKAWALEQLKPKSHEGALRFTIPALGEDSEGELYVFSNATSQIINKSGKVWKIVPAK
ncbi:MAG TPA: PQQ-dependent sugar dehydrogenase [Verrucomicrobiae bacterium]|nr:PQQ-dependent sugar dehydrogenase [Verrucomicrobiae bacterium]